MNKICFVFILSLFFVSNLPGQVKMGFTNAVANTNGEIVVVDVRISDFTNIVAMQFSLNWNKDIFGFSSIQNVTSDLPQFTEAGNIGTPPSAQAVSDGQLTVSWSLTSTAAVSLPDSTLLFSLRLIATGINCDATAVTISDLPRVTEFIDEDFNEIGVETTGGAISISNGSCSGGNADDVFLIIDDLSAPKGSSICIPVTTMNFDSIASLQSGVTWDPAILQFTGINDGGLTSVTANSTKADEGELKVLWFFDTEAVSLGNGATLFELCFDVIGNTGQSSDVKLQNLSDLNVEISDANANSLDFVIDSGVFTVGSGGGGGNENGVGLKAPDLFTGNASSICVPISTKNFTNIAAFQTGIGFDPAVLTFTGRNDVSLSSVNIGDTQAANGELRVLWSVDLGSNSITLEDDEVLFELCFDVVGNIGEVSPIGFINIPFFPIEVVNEDAIAVEFFINDGSVTIGDDTNAPGFSLTSSSHTVSEGDTVCVDVLVEGFTDIQGMGFTIAWDDAVIDYIDQRNFNLPNLGGASNFNFVDPDRLKLVWTPPSTVTVPDGTSIFQVCFEAVAPCDMNASSIVDFVSDPTLPIEIINANNQVINIAINAGTVTVDSCDNPIQVISITSPTCGGDSDGAIAVDFVGLTGTISCTWADEEDNMISNVCNLVGVPGGNYTLTATDETNEVAMKTILVSAPDPLMVTAIIVDRTCDLESVLSLSVSGGVSNSGTYDFDWSGGLGNQSSFTDINGGTYDVTITDDNNCTLDTSFVVKDSSIITSPDITLITNLTGDNGSITLNAQSDGILTYAWSGGETTDGVSGLVPGSYSVTITNDDGCEKIENFELDWGAVFGDNIINTTTTTYDGIGITCFGESDGILNGMVIGGCNQGPVTIQLDGQVVTLPFTGLRSGDYELKIEDSCGNTFVQLFSLLDPDLIQTSDIVTECSNPNESTGTANLNLTGGIGGYTITTSAGNAVGNTGRIENLPEGVFTVIVEDDNGCQVMFQNVAEIEQCVLFDCDVSRSVISPNGDNINDNFEVGCLVGSSNQPNDLTIYDRWGNLVFQNINYDNSWQGTDMNGSQLDEGGYMWVLVVGNPGTREIFRGTVTILR